MAKKVKTESVALFNHKFEAIRPFGPTVIRGKVPMDLIHLLDKKATKMLGSKQLSKEFNHAPNLAGNVQKEVRFPSSWMSTEEFKPMVEFIGEMVKAATFSGHKLQYTPEVGDVFLFPNWLSHGVYPFRTQGQERRSVSFNLELIKKEGPTSGNAETLRNKKFYKK